MSQTPIRTNWPGHIKVIYLGGTLVLNEQNTNISTARAFSSLCLQAALHLKEFVLKGKSSLLFVLSENIEAESHNHAEAETGCVEDALSHHKAHWEEQVGGWHKRQHDER